MARELAEMPEAGTVAAKVALVFDYPSSWAWKRCRRVRISPISAWCSTPTKRFAGPVCRLIFCLRRRPVWRVTNWFWCRGFCLIPDALEQAIAAFDGTVILGPRSGSRTPDFTIPTPLPPNAPGLDVTVSRVESLPPFAPMPLETGAFKKWFEHLEGHGRGNAGPRRTGDRR